MGQLPCPHLYRSLEELEAELNELVHHGGSDRRTTASSDAIAQLPSTMDGNNQETHELCSPSNPSLCGRLSADVEAIPMILKTCKTYQELWAALFYRFCLVEKCDGESKAKT